MRKPFDEELRVEAIGDEPADSDRPTLRVLQAVPPEELPTRPYLDTLPDGAIPNADDSEPQIDIIEGDVIVIESIPPIPQSPPPLPETSR